MGSDAARHVSLAVRVALLGGAMAALAATCATPGLGAARVVAALAVVAAIWSLWRRVGQGDAELARFVEAVTHGDLSQAFRRTGALGAALEAAMARLRAERRAAGEGAEVQAALADEAPAALLLIDAGGRVSLANKAARRLLRTHEGTRVPDFAAYGAPFAAALAGAEPGTRTAVAMLHEGVTQQVVLTASALSGPAGAQRVIAVQPIQGELDRAELIAQAGIVRVLTHEIMNSLTPVVSLSGIAAALMAGLDTARDPDLADAAQAVATLGRRTAGIMRFVETYRSLSRPPMLHPRPFDAAPWLDQLARLHRAGALGAVPLEVVPPPPGLVVRGDPELLAQVVLNLLKNAAEAATETAGKPGILLRTERLPGGRPAITVADNGAGVLPERRAELFLPFFTTKPGGTGVGLSLARQIVLAHGGSIDVDDAEGGGALFRVVL